MSAIKEVKAWAVVDPQGRILSAGIRNSLLEAIEHYHNNYGDWDAAVAEAVTLGKYKQKALLACEIALIQIEFDGNKDVQTVLSRLQNLLTSEK